MRIIENKYLTIRPSKSKPTFIFVALPKPTGGQTCQRIYIKRYRSLEQAFEAARDLRDRLGKQFWGSGFDVKTSTLIAESMVTAWPKKPKFTPKPKPALPSGASPVKHCVVPRTLKQKETIIKGAERQLCEVVPGVKEVFFAVPLGKPPVGVFKVDYEDRHGNPAFHSFRFGCHFPRLDALFAALKCKEEIERTETGRKKNANRRS